MANKRPIIVSKEDHQRLERLFTSRLAAAFSDKPYLQALRGELDSARIVAPDKMPPNVVTMNSTVRLRDVRSKEFDSYTLVYPQNADIGRDRLSVLAPIGTAILGHRVGDLVRWQVPSGWARFRIEELAYQPERDGVDAECGAWDRFAEVERCS